MEDFTKVDQELRQEFLKLNKPAKYGTAGFRDLATNMPYVSTILLRYLLELERLLLFLIELLLLSVSELSCQPATTK